MPNRQKYFYLGTACCFFLVILTKFAYGDWPKPERKPTKGQIVREKKYSYIRAHDFNGDGAVDNRDRLRWLRAKATHYETVYISTENQDILEAMDIDGDGDVEDWEMRDFYNSYDVNKNGSLEDEEIEAAAGE